MERIEDTEGGSKQKKRTQGEERKQGDKISEDMRRGKGRIEGD